MMEYKKDILALKDGEEFTWPESDYGRAEIWRKHDFFFLFSIPTFGGQPQFNSFFSLNRIDELIETVERWT